MNVRELKIALARLSSDMEDFEIILETSSNRERNFDLLLATAMYSNFNPPALVLLGKTSFELLQKTNSVTLPPKQKRMRKRNV